ncbi:MAG: hypothetical protein K0R58_3118 [Ramlibacter sp.]|nr:hypothetical protein [Ramlibacter sp.]MCE3272852.1 hypothetical protein [Ramlibacter sp.]
MLALKLALVAASILLATLVARRFGHALGGVVGGMPMVAAPICAILLLDQGAEAVRAIALAALVCIPGSVVHSVSVAWSARRAPWPLSVGFGLVLFTAVSLALTWLRLPAAASCLLALAAPSLGLLASPRVARIEGPVHLPRAEMVLRLVAAVAMAAAVILSAAAFPAAVSGLLLAVPIAGTVLPCFTLPRHGAQATAALMGGFVMGLHGFAAFFVVLYLGLGSLGRLPAFVLALVASGVVAVAAQRLGRLAARRRAF